MTNNKLQIVIFILFSSLFSLAIGRGRRIPDWQIRIAQKQGVNTCAVEEVPGSSNKKYWTECKYWANREICGTKTIIRYECCEGFEQVQGKRGCAGVKPMTDVFETARSLGATNFVDLLFETGIADMLKKDGAAHTLFAPTNQAFKRMKLIYQELFNHSLENISKSPLLYHISPRKILSKNFGSDLRAETLLGGPGLRINRYSNGMMTVNCAPIIRKDQEATDGLVHLLDQVLLPPSSEGFASVPEVIFYDGRFRELSQALLQSKLVNELRSKKGPFTIFAPSDEAFQKLSPKELDKISGNPKLQLALLENHIVPHPVCPTAIISNHKMTTLGGRKIEFSCNGTATFVGNVKLTGEVIQAKNGLVVVVDGILIPDEVKGLSEVASDRLDLSIFSEISRLGKYDELISDESMLEPSSMFTLFVPSNEAFREVPETRMKKLLEDGEEARSFLNYHTVHGQVTTDTVTDNRRLETLDKQHTLRLKVYRKAVGIESAIVIEADISTKNGMMHVIDKVMFPPDFSSLELFRKDHNFSVFSEAIEKVQESDPDFLKVFENNSLTIFAPNDGAFGKLASGQLDMLMEDTKTLKQVLQNHVIDKMVASGSFQSRLLYKVSTENEPLEIRKGEGGRLMVNKAKVVEADLLTKDGIVHGIDKVLLTNLLETDKQDQH